MWSSMDMWGEMQCLVTSVIVYLKYIIIVHILFIYRCCIVRFNLNGHVIINGYVRWDVMPIAAYINVWLMYIIIVCVLFVHRCCIVWSYLDGHVILSGYVRWDVMSNDMCHCVLDIHYYCMCTVYLQVCIVWSYPDGHVIFNGYVKCSVIQFNSGVGTVWIMCWSIDGSVSSK